MISNDPCLALISAAIPACSGILGVIIGGLLSFFVHRKEKQWALETLRRQWKRDRLVSQIDGLLNLVTQSLTQLRFLAEGLRKQDPDLHQQAALAVDTVTAAHLASITIPDQEFAERFFDFASIVGDIRERHKEDTLSEQQLRVCIEEAQAAARQVGMRAEELLSR